MNQLEFYGAMDAVCAEYAGETVARLQRPADPHKSLIFRVTTLAAAAAVLVILIGAGVIMYRGRQSSLRTPGSRGEYAAAEAVKMQAQLTGEPHDNAFRFPQTAEFQSLTLDGSVSVSQTLGTAACTEQGIYSLCAPGTDSEHYTQQGICYTDFATGETLYLCANPACLHDGSAFCAATTPAYRIAALAYTDGMLYAAATKATGDAEKPYLAVLLAVQPDGSGTQELCVLSDRGEIGSCEMIAHRGALWVSVTVEWTTEVEDLRGTQYNNGACYALWHYEIAPRRLTWITGSAPEGHAYNRNVVADLQGAGDYVYFTQQWGGNGYLLEQGLYRVNAQTGVIEQLPQNPDQMFGYGVSGDLLCYVQKAAEASEETAGIWRMHICDLAAGTETECDVPRAVQRVFTDGSRIYVDTGLPAKGLLCYDRSGVLQQSIPYTVPETDGESDDVYFALHDGKLQMIRVQHQYGINDDAVWDYDTVTLSAPPRDSAAADETAFVPYCTETALMHVHVFTPQEKQ